MGRVFLKLGAYTPAGIEEARIQQPLKRKYEKLHAKLTEVYSFGLNTYSSEKAHSWNTIWKVLEETDPSQYKWPNP